MTDNASCINSVLTDCVTALVCPLGEFYPNKNYGSQIKRNIAVIDCEKLIAYARQAVNDMDGVYIKSAVLDDCNAVFTVMINDEERQVSIAYE